MSEAREVLERTFRALEARDRDGVVASFAADAALFDPHYPKPTMNGRAEIAEGLDWGLSVMARFGFTIRHFFASEDGLSGAAEVATDHTLKAGNRRLVFPQVFVVETAGGLITALRAYEPYGPNGMGGFFLGLSRLRRRLSGKPVR